MRATNEDVWKQVQSLDLDLIKSKLMHSEEGKNWTQEHLTVALKQYRQFLYLKYFHEDTETILTADIRKVWECHVLDTQKYRQDCQTLFGYFLHFENEGDDRAVDRQTVENILATLEEQFDLYFNSSTTMTLGSP